MKNRIFLAFYKGHGGNLLDKLTDFVVRVFTRGEFSHCEIAVEKQINFTDRYDCDTVYDCYSSSPRDGGVRVKRIDVSDAKTWTLIPLNDVSENQIKAYFNRTLGKKYDFIGALGVVFGIKQKRSKYFCSEWCFNAIFGNENGWRFSPNQLAAMFKQAPLPFVGQKKECS